MSRSLKKGPFIDFKLRSKVAEAKKSNKRESIKTWSRSCTVIPEFVGSVIAVHNGNKFVSVVITEGMVGHKLGEFAPTRTFRVHSGDRQASKS